MFSRRDFLKKTGLALGSLVLGNSLNSKVVNGESYKDITGQILEASQEEFKQADKYKTITPKAGNMLFLGMQKNAGSLAKFYPVNNEDVPYAINYDYREGGPLLNQFVIPVPYIGIFTVSSRQISRDSAKFKMNLAKSPSELPEKYRGKSSKDDDPLLWYQWKIDTDRNKETGKGGDYVGADFLLELEGDGEDWETNLKEHEKYEKLPIEDFAIRGNEIEATVNLEDLGDPESFDFAAQTSSKIKTPDANWETDSSPDIKDPTRELEPGTLKIDPDYEGDGQEELTKIYELPSHIEDIEVNENSEVRLMTKNSEFLFDFQDDGIRIREKV